MDAYDLLVIGRSCLDYIAVVDRFPEENRKAPLRYRLTEGGGQGGTASCCVARLGGKVAYVGKLGDDDEGRFCLNRFEAFGVSTEFMEIVPGGKTPVAYAFVTAGSGARTIIYERNELPRISVDDTVQTLLRQCRAILLDPEVTYLVPEVVRHRPDGVKLVYDCERWRPGIEAVMTGADYFIPSFEFLSATELNVANLPLERQLAKLKRLVAGRLVVSHGENGAYYYDGDRLLQVAAPQVEAIDTIGAGDNFHAAFALGLAKGFDFEACVKFAVAVASLSCRAYGGRQGVPGFARALELSETLQTRALKSGC